MNDTPNQDTISTEKPETTEPEAPTKKRNLPLGLPGAIVVCSIVGLLPLCWIVHAIRVKNYEAAIALVPGAFLWAAIPISRLSILLIDPTQRLAAKILLLLGISTIVVGPFCGVARFLIFGVHWRDALFYSFFYAIFGILVVVFRKRLLAPPAKSKKRRPEKQPSVPFVAIQQEGTSIRTKSRVGFVLFALFFGAFGIHNFYALRIKSAVAQLLLTLFTGVALGAVTGIAYAAKWAWWLENGWLVAAIVEPVVVLGVWIWSIVEICVVSRDGRGVPMQ